MTSLMPRKLNISDKWSRFVLDDAISSATLVNNNFVLLSKVIFSKRTVLFDM